MPPAAEAEEYSEEDDEDAAGDLDTDEEGEEITGHHVTSAKSVPGKQPRPLTTSATSTNGAGESVNTSANGSTMNRATVGGKGKRGEEALENAVAAREEVERRRVELKDQPGGGGRSSKMVAREAAVAEGEAAEPRVKDEEVEEEVLHGEDAEETLAPVSVTVQAERNVTDRLLCT